MLICDLDKMSEYYVGLHDTERESYFEWIDNSPVDYLSWLGGEPNNNLFLESCTYFLVYKTAKLK